MIKIYSCLILCEESNANNFGILDGSQSYTFQGYLAYIKLYNQTLSASQINNLYTSIAPE